MHIYSKDQQAFHLKRTRVEFWWSRINVGIVLIQFACFLSAIIRTSMAARASMTNSFFLSSALSLKAPYLVDGCEFNVTRDHAFFKNVRYTMSKDNVGYFVSRGVVNIRCLIAITAVHAVLSATNRLWFDTNTHEIRYHYVVFRKDMVMMWEILLMVLGLVVVFSITRENQIMTDYLNFCTRTGEAGIGGYNSVPPYIELSVSYIISLVATVLNALLAVWHLSKQNPRDALIREAKLQEEEWRKAMLQYHGMGSPDAAIAASSTVVQPDGHADSSSPQVIYADNRAATVNPNASTASAPPEGDGWPVKDGEVGQRPHHHSGHHSFIPKGPACSPNAISSSMQRRFQNGDSIGLDELPPSSLPHVGPSVSRPHTPLLNEDYGQEEMVEGLHYGTSGGVVGDQLESQVTMSGPGAAVDYSNSGRYELHEVGDDDEEEEEEREATAVLDVAKSTPPDSRGSFALPGRAGGGGARGASASDASTALVASRLATGPPPPPVHGADSQPRIQTNRGKMLAPPSPLQCGAETTDDTVHLQ
ncbi:hypothetical protein JKF63_05143 [Porcisia hertigi]|uniref:Uncharacterized protein n=1 Tax=Porcisia hertigi TaxID=2761500 RepID=A0A836LCX4_9TRYP|nr:hypothetical protein JKF63_05143 [Porcisia hertigi]